VKVENLLECDHFEVFFCPFACLNQAQETITLECKCLA
jgi:hypothetical protein